jgi:hypothetical protein
LLMDWPFNGHNPGHHHFCHLPLLLSELC